MRTHLEIDYLRAFCEVADTRNFTRAAHRLHRVQSTISMQIKRLEEVVGVQLFERTRRSVSLTSEGEMLLPRARRLLRLNAEVLSEFERSVLQGTVRVGMTATSSCFLPEVIAQFRQAYPSIQLDVVCDLSWNLLDAFEAEKLDLVLVTQDGGRAGGTLVRREPLVWVAAKGHQTERINPLPIALFGKGCIFRDAVMEALDAMGRPWRIAFSSPNNGGVQAAITTGMAVGAVAESTLASNLRVLGPRDGFPELPEFAITLYWNRDECPEPVRQLAVKVLDKLGHHERRPSV